MTTMTNGRGSVTALRADLLAAISGEEMGRREARYLVDLYYQVQDYRKSTANQARAAGEAEEPHGAITLILGELTQLEKTIQGALDRWTDLHHMGLWAKSHYGIGPVISAGLLAHIDIERAQTAGAVWRFAGLDPTQRWGKGEKRPWNADLKVLCWKIGDSFCKFHNREDCFYGALYAKRKQKEVAHNEAGDFAEQAAQTLVDRNIKEPKTKAAYEDGRLPDGRIEQRARRWAVKLFLAHWWEEAYREHHGTEPPLPYPIAQMGHAHRIEAP